VQILPNETKHFKSGKILTGNYKNNEIKNSIVWIESVRFSDGTIK
jgi:hypothetical protein